MSTVQTARGPIDSSQLGKVLIHEHVFLMDMEYTINYRPDFFTPETIDTAAARLGALRDVGIDTIIDLTVLGLGRHVPSLIAVAEKTDVNIVLSTGLYTFDALPGPFQFHGPGLMCDAPEPLVDLFIRDITEGMGGTAIKAGMLKCAIDEPGLTKGVERVMRAAGQANRATGTPITVHTAPREQTGLEVQRVLAEEGVDLADVIIGHCGDSDDIDYLMRLADKGSTLGMDRFGLNFDITTQARVDTIAGMVRRGYGAQLTLSHDCCICWSDYFPKFEDYRRAMPDHQPRHIHDDVIPMLREAGVEEADIEAMFVNNPRRVFEAAAGRN
jgi:phosphotriesterase-related protein